MDIGNLNQMSVEITTMILPWIGILISVIVAIWLKDTANSVAKGWAFKSNQAFNEGDHIILDGRDAIIVKIGMTTTVFGVYSTKGYTWKYVPNSKLDSTKVEKIINRDLHLDTDAEKGKVLQKMIDAAQSDAIKLNENAIKANRELIEKSLNNGGK
jgi:hypothetical protein